MIYEDCYDSWIVFYSVGLCCTRLEEALVRPIIGGRTEKPVTRLCMTNEEGQHSKKRQQMNLKNAHMRAIATQKKEPTASGCSFDKQTLKGEFIGSC